MDDAMELLFTMPYSCALDIVDAYPDGLSSAAVGYVFGVSEQSIKEQVNRPHVSDALEEIREYLDA